MFITTGTFLLVGLVGLQTSAGLSTGTFTWPTSTQQCGTYNLTIFDGTPPWTMVFAPIGGQPIYWDITAPARYDGTKSVTADIPVQLPGGTPYTVFMQDASGYFGGLNPTQIQVTGIGPSSDCLENVIAHTQDFTFTVSGSTAMCEDDFQISWQDTVGNGPHNFTVLPLDSSTSPWEQPLNGGGTTTGASGWNVNMTTGTRFTIMMNNGDAYGSGGVGGIYQVGEGSSNSCIIAPMYTTAAWPGSLQTTTLLGAAALPTSVITSRSVRGSSTASDVSGDEGSSEVASSSRATAPPVTVIVTASDSAGGGGLSTGATAGIGAGVGVLALGAIIAGLLFWLRKRKRSQGTTNDYARPVDLNDDGGGGMGRQPMSSVEPKVEPYPSPAMTGVSEAPQMAYNRTSLAPGSTADYSDYGAAAAAMNGSQQHHSRTSMAYTDGQMSPVGNSDQHSMASHAPQTNPYFPPTGQAGPLPSKANLARQSYQSQSQPHHSFHGPPGALAPPSPGSVSGSSSSGRPLPGPPMQSMSEAGTNDTKVDTPHAEHESHDGTQGHAHSNIPELGPVFNIHRDAEAAPEGQSGMIDLPPMYQDVPQRREAGSQPASPTAGPSAS